MKKFILLPVIALLSLSGFSQNLVDVIVWEANTKSGGKFIGVTNDEFEAENVVDEIKFEFEGTKYEIVSFHVNQTTVELKPGQSDAADNFISDHDALAYKYISEIELIALEYVEDNDVTTAVSFYTNVSRQKSKEKAKVYLENLHNNYSKYLFNLQSVEQLVSYSE